jgi:predicted XRE-type DNA-binding protein
MYKHVTNVWASEAKTPEEAIALQVRADLMIDLRQIIEDNGWNQKEAAQQLGLTQNRISYIVNGQVSKFTTDKLIGLLSKLGYNVELSIKAA